MARYRSYSLRHERQIKRRRRVRVLISLGITLFVLLFYFVSPRVLGSDGMAPTLGRGDYLLTTPVSYGPQIRLLNARLPGLREIDRGDIVLADPAYTQHRTWYQKAARGIFGTITGGRWVPFEDGEWERSPIVKRVIGLPGDRVEIVDNRARVWTADSAGYATEFDLSNLSYSVQLPVYPEGWSVDDPLGGDWANLELGPNEYYLLGDNRGVFHDSRTFGPVDKSQIISRVLLRYWPRYASFR